MNHWVAVVLLAVLLMGPLLFAPLEHNIEWFFLGIGAVAILASGDLTLAVARQAVTSPLPISIAVIVAGALFSLGEGRFAAVIEWLGRRLPRSLLTGAATFVIAGLASVITAIIAALVFSVMVRLLRVEERRKAPTVVAGCFAIGLGAALTPVGEPLATIAVAALKIGPLGLVDLLGWYIVPGMVICSALAGFFARGTSPAPRFRGQFQVGVQSPLAFVAQGIRIYAFVAGLVLISEAFAPVAREVIARLSPTALYWGNTISAVADNATLVAFELDGMSSVRAREALLALLLAGGMLIPGNVPNIICAARLEIGSRAWAAVGIPLGLLMLTAYFMVLRGLGNQ